MYPQPEEPRSLSRGRGRPEHPPAILGDKGDTKRSIGDIGFFIEYLEYDIEVSKEMEE